jgi:hypothetical protein
LLVLGEFAVSDPQHGVEDLLGLWIIQILVGLLVFIIISITMAISVLKRP